MSDGIKLTLSPEDLEFYKKYKLPVPTSPTMMSPAEYGRRVEQDERVKKTKKGTVDRRTDAFAAIAQQAYQAQATNVPVKVDNGDIDLNRNFVGPTPGQSRFKERKTIEEVIKEGYDVHLTPSGKVKIVDAQGAEVQVDPEKRKHLRKVVFGPVAKGKEAEAILDVARNADSSQGANALVTQALTQEQQDAEQQRNTAQEAIASGKQDEVFKSSAAEVVQPTDNVQPEANDKVNSFQRFVKGAVQAPSELVGGMTALGGLAQSAAADTLGFENLALLYRITMDQGIKFAQAGRKAGAMVARIPEDQADPKNIGDTFVEEVGGVLTLAPLAGLRVLKPAAAAIGGTTDAIIGTAVNDVVYDLSDPKYQSLPDVIKRQPASKTAEAAANVDIAPSPQDVQASSFYKDAGIEPWHVMGFALGAGSAALGYKLLKSTPPRNVKTSDIDTQGNPSLRKVDLDADKGTQSATTPTELVRTVHSDSAFAIKSQFARAVGDEAKALDFADDVVQRTHLGGVSSANWSLRTGRIVTPQRTLQMPSPHELHIAFNKLTPEQQKVFNEGMMAADILDDLNLGKKPAIAGINHVQARSAMTRMRTDPVLKKVETEYRKVMDTMLDFFEDTSALDTKAIQFLRSRRSHYMPNMEGGADDYLTELGEALGRTYEKDGFAGDSLASLFSRDNNKAIRNFAPPMEAMGNYVRAAIQYGYQNDLRRRYVQAITQSADPEIKNSVKVLGASEKKATDTHSVIHYNDAGKRVRVEVADPLIAHALKFAPNTAQYAAVNEVRRLFQIGTTGVLQPAFAPITMMREATLGSIFASKGRKMGMIDASIQKVTGGRVAYRGDITAIGSSIVGAVGDSYARVALDASNRIRAHMLARPDSIFKQLDDALGTPISARVADRLRDSYLTSWRGIMDSYGGYNVGMTIDAIEAGRSVIDKSKAEFGRKLGPQGITLWNAYKATIENMHNGARSAYFMHNYNPKMKPAEVKRLAGEARDLTADLSITGAGPQASKLRKPGSNQQAVQNAMAQVVNRGLGPISVLGRETSIYYNPIIRGFERSVKAIVDNPLGTTTGVANLVMGGSAAGLTMAAYLDYLDANSGEKAAPSPIDAQGVVNPIEPNEYINKPIDTGRKGYLDYMMNRPEWRKATSMYFPIMGLPPEEGLEIPIAPELGFLSSMWVAGMDQALSGAQFNTAGNADIPLTVNVSDLVQRDVSTEAGLAGYNALGSLFGFALPIPFALWDAAHSRDSFGTFNTYDVKPERVSGSGELMDGQDVSSALTIPVQRLVEETFGVAGNIMVNAFDTGYSAYKTGENIPLAVGRQSVGDFKDKLTMFKPLTGSHREYNANFSDQLYSKWRRIGNLLDVYRAQIRDEGQYTKSRPVSGSPIISSDVSDSLRVLPAQSAKTMRPVVNEKFKQIAPLLNEVFAKNTYGLKDITSQRAALRKQIDDLEAVNHGNIRAMSDTLKANGVSGGDMKAVKLAINRKRHLVNVLNRALLQAVQEFERKHGVDLAEIDPFSN
jgi:exosome complex RNA-binding protein Csl4